MPIASKSLMLPFDKCEGKRENKREDFAHALTHSVATVYKSRTNVSCNVYFPFSSYKAFVQYTDRQCARVNMLTNLKIVSSSYNPWVYYVLMVPSTSYMEGAPIAGVLTLPSGFPITAPIFTRVRGNHINLAARSEHNLPWWKKHKLCANCAECQRAPYKCSTCVNDECEQINTTKDPWDYYDNWDIILTSVCEFYIRANVKNASEINIHIKKTIRDCWASYRKLCAVLNHRQRTCLHMPLKTCVYGREVRARALSVPSNKERLISVPARQIPRHVLNMGWKTEQPKGYIKYTSAPMSFHSTTHGEGYSLTLKPSAELFAENFNVTFALVSGGARRTLAWNSRGYKMFKRPHENETWSNHGAILDRVVLIHATIARNQFVMSIQHSSTAPRVVIGGVPVGMIKHIFREQDEIFLSITMATNGYFGLVPLKKGTVVDGDLRQYTPTHTPKILHMALVIQDSYRLSEVVQDYVFAHNNVRRLNKHYSGVDRMHIALGKTVRGKTAHAKTVFTITVTHVYIGEHMVVFSVLSIKPVVRLVRRPFIIAAHHNGPTPPPDEKFFETATVYVLASPMHVKSRMMQISCR